MASAIQRTTSAEQKIAKKALSDIDKLVDAFLEREKSVTIEVGDDEHTHIEVPPSIFAVLKDVLTNMAAGRAFSVVTTDTEISTQVAAEMLNVSRPYIVKLLEAGKIPYTKVGSHRRVKIEDVLMYKANLKKTADDALQNLSDQAQELDLGY